MRNDLQETKTEKAPHREPQEQDAAGVQEMIMRRPSSHSVQMLLCMLLLLLLLLLLH